MIKSLAPCSSSAWGEDRGTSIISVGDYTKGNMSGLHNEVLLNYCTETDLENFLLLDIDSSFSLQVETWIAAAEGYVNNYLGYTTASGVLKEQITGEKAYAYVDTEGNLMVFPEKTPIVSISALSLIKGSDSLTLDLTDSDGNTRYNIPTNGKYMLYPGEEISLSGTSIINSFMDIKFIKFFTNLNYIAGYSQVPYPIRQATINVTSDFIMRHSNKEALEGITQGRISKRWFSRLGDRGQSDFIQDAHQLLRPYRQSARWI